MFIILTFPKAKKKKTWENVFKLSKSSFPSTKGKLSRGSKSKEVRGRKIMPLGSLVFNRSAHSFLRKGQSVAKYF